MAKKFSFRLAPVLKLKEFYMDSAKEGLLAILQDRRRIENDIQSRNDILQQKSNIEPPTQIHQMQTQQYYRDAVREEIATLKQRLESTIELEHIKRRELAEAVKEKKAMQKLQERQSVEHNKQLGKEEQKLLDEIADNGKRFRL